MSRHSKRIFFLVLTVGSLALSGCGLLVDAFSSNSGMTRQEKANLNLQLGVRYLELGMLNEAKANLYKSLDLDSSNADIHNAIAIFNERINNDEEAREHYQTAVSLKPDDSNIKNNYGRYLCEKGSHNEGIALLTQAAAMPLNNRPWFALTNLGLCYAKQNDNNTAEQHLRKALQANPSYAQALAEMQRISYANQQYMSARGFLERYLNVAKHTSETLWIAMNTERMLGNTSLSDEYKQQLISSFPASKEAQWAKSAIQRD